MKTTKSSTKVVNLFIFIISVLLLMPCIASAGELAPTAPPASTMRTLDEIYQKLSKVESMLANLTNFSEWGPNPRYRINYNGTPDPNDDTVLDTASGLIWARNANIANGTKNWNDAMTYCDNLVLARKDDWRLPSRDDLATLLAEPYPSALNPDLPTGHPFLNVQAYYWSSTEIQCSAGEDCAYFVRMSDGASYNRGAKTGSLYVWPVRGQKQ